tara:strand:+ start:27 stop:623 length:597 start_codon:yes stop_codon:yes gene_type:complete
MINKISLEIFFKKILLKAKENYDEFNSLDGQLGDGDLGITISKGLEEINKNISNFDDDLGKTFLLCAQSFTKASSSSFGTLVAVSFMTIAKESKGKENISVDEFSILIDKIIEAVCYRGKSNIGDKTFIDTLYEVSHILKSSKNDIGINIHKATKNALDKFKGKECKIGRARMFLEKSKELNDPGMFALHKLSSIFVE